LGFEARIGACQHKFIKKRVMRRIGVRREHAATALGVSALAEDQYKLHEKHHTHRSERGEHHEAKGKRFCILSVGGDWGGKPVRSGGAS